jgi:hypothetical protein
MQLLFSNNLVFPTTLTGWTSFQQNFILKSELSGVKKNVVKHPEKS